jgi:hypothetical protein
MRGYRTALFLRSVHPERNDVFVSPYRTTRWYLPATRRDHRKFRNKNMSSTKSWTSGKQYTVDLESTASAGWDITRTRIPRNRNKAYRNILSDDTGNLRGSLPNRGIEIDTDHAAYLSIVRSSSFSLIPILLFLLPLSLSLPHHWRLHGETSVLTRSGRYSVGANSGQSLDPIGL